MRVNCFTVIKFIFRSCSLLVHFFIDPVMTFFCVIPPDFVFRKEKETFLPINLSFGLRLFIHNLMLVLLTTTLIALNVGGDGGGLPWWLWIAFLLEERSPNVPDSILMTGLRNFAHFLIENKGNLVFVFSPSDYFLGFFMATVLLFNNIVADLLIKCEIGILDVVGFILLEIGGMVPMLHPSMALVTVQALGASGVLQGSDALAEVPQRAFLGLSQGILT